MLHHTATKEWTLQGNLNWLLWIRASNNPVSAFALIDTNWDTYKLSEPTDITRHAWSGKRLNIVNDMNNYSLWIEVIWPLKDWWFTFEQKVALKKLVRYLMKTFNIPKENVIRHKDYTSRKTDISDAFWNTKYKSFQDRKNTL